MFVCAFEEAVPLPLDCIIPVSIRYYFCIIEVVAVAVFYYLGEHGRRTCM